MSTSRFSILKIWEEEQTTINRCLSPFSRGYIKNCNISKDEQIRCCVSLWVPLLEFLHSLHTPVTSIGVCPLLGESIKGGRPHVKASYFSFMEGRHSACLLNATPPQGLGGLKTSWRNNRRRHRPKPPVLGGSAASRLWDRNLTHMCREVGTGDPRPAPAFWGLTDQDSMPRSEEAWASPV